MGFDPGDQLDDIGRRLVKELQDNARLSYSELGRRVGLTPPAVAERMRRMEEAGVIRGYRAEVDASKLGYPITAFVRVSARAASRTEITDIVEDFPEVLECHRVTGVDCFVMRVAVTSVQHLQELIDRLMPFGDTVTSIVLSSPVASRAIEAAAAAEEERPEAEATG